jgi:hypothetical protein
VRIVLDGLDQLPAAVTPVVLAALNTVSADPTLAAVRLVVTARWDATLPTRHHLFDLNRVPDPYIERYLRRRDVPPKMAAAIVDQAAGNWLVARVLADLATDAEAPTMGPAALYDAYRDELLRAGAADPSSWTEALGPVLSALAVAGTGPVLPLPLLCYASGLLGGPDQPARVRDVLVRLRGLVVRGNPGTPDEHIGTFHSTFAAYLCSGRDSAIDERAAHQALADAIRALRLSPASWNLRWRSPA